MPTNWKALQAMETVETLPDPVRPGKTLQTKQRRPVADVNVKQMSMGSWHASLSREGRSIDNLGAKSSKTGSAGTQTAKVKK